MYHVSCSHEVVDETALQIIVRIEAKHGAIGLFGFNVGFELVNATYDSVEDVAFDTATVEDNSLRSLFAADSTIDSSVVRVYAASTDGVELEPGEAVALYEITVTRQSESDPVICLPRIDLARGGASNALVVSGNGGQSLDLVPAEDITVEVLVVPPNAEPEVDEEDAPDWLDGQPQALIDFYMESPKERRAIVYEWVTGNAR